jgi:hypothetical protein
MLNNFKVNKSKICNNANITGTYTNGRIFIPRQITLVGNGKFHVVTQKTIPDLIVTNNSISSTPPGPPVRFEPYLVGKTRNAVIKDFLLNYLTLKNLTVRGLFVFSL